MKKQLKYTHITQKDFKSIKTLQRAGINANQASKATKRTYRTIANIFNSDTFQDYKNIASDHIKKQKETLAATETLSEVIRQAKKTGGLIITTHAAFVGFDDVYDFVKEASDNEVTVTFAPMGK